ncbi:disease resistance protein RGA2 [Cocos nucifera]|uniref:Disease resistance protein RGA2 n=1 Tax=Cocos nucifera TaxID=13894 RepID=A0A8K0IBR6_COCNU|nr:disease resistance protein RGA2 [Cocos nucifera]
MAERLTVGDWFGSVIIRKLVADVRSIEEEGPFRSEIQNMLRRLPELLRQIQARIDDAEEERTGSLQSLKSLKDVLYDDAEEGRTGRFPSKALKDVLYEADDLLDEFRFEILSTKMNGDKKVWRFPKKVRFRHCLMNLKNLLSKLEILCIPKFAFYTLYVDISKKKRTEIRRISTSFMTDIVIGREDEKEEIVRTLLSSDTKSWDNRGVGSSSGHVFGVLPLVGIGGIGKTTLAQLVYNDERVKMHFDIRAWCCVPDNFDIKTISKELSDDLSDTSSDTETIIMVIRLALSNKKFFIVFDDVWDETPAHWEILRNILRCGARGSKVLVTTRSARVADIMRTMDTIMVRGLSEDECRAIFKLFAFGDGNLEYLLKKDGNLEYEEWKKLEPIAMQICRKLGGLPLAAKVLGSRLRTELDENYWRAILESEWWELDLVSEGVLPTLKLSYQHLNANLRQCFAYCSLFPRGYMFERLKLVQMWLAQGYIKLDEREEMTAEDIGSQWFDELRDRCFFQPAEENRYVMHDMMHDLAVTISLDDCFVVEDESENIPCRVRHLAIRTDKLDVLEEVSKFKCLRTLLFFGDYEFSKVPEDMFKYLKGLRVLDLSSTPIEKLPHVFGGLSHLRYLDISNTKIRLLPTTFSKLCNLQVLNLQGCHFQELAKGMNKLINLRYLYGDSEIVSQIDRIGELTNLHYLEEFPVRQKRGHGIGELKNLKNLQGQLSIKSLENVKTKEEAMMAELKNKTRLNALQLEWSSTRRNQPDVEKEVLEGLQPHLSLKELSILHYDGIVYPDWMAGNQCLINLVRIRLCFCHRWENLPSFGQLPVLRILHFENMPALTRIGDQFYGNVDMVFRSLKQLTFFGLKNLKEWSEIDRHQFFPRLRQIQIKDCWSLTKCPFLSIDSSVEELEIDYCGDLSIALPGCLQKFTSLTLLVISRYHHRTSISLSILNKLENLHLEDCPELSIPDGLHSLANLKKLHIEGCPMLNESSLPKQPDVEKGLQSLTDLCMDDSILLNDGWVLLGSLSSLRILNFQHFKHVGYFSKEQELWFHQLTSIQELGISYCLNLERLPAELSPLLSLKKLSITNCPKIMSLPENGLPISLEELQISGCPTLGERCSGENGSDSPKIAHIPFITIKP